MANVLLIGNVYSDVDKKLHEIQLNALKSNGFIVHEAYKNASLFNAIKGFSFHNKIRFMVMHYQDDLIDMDNAKLYLNDTATYLNKPIFIDGTDDEFCLSGLICDASWVVSYVIKNQLFNKDYHMKWIDMLYEIKNDERTKTVQNFIYNVVVRDEEIEMKETLKQFDEVIEHNKLLIGYLNSQTS